ncbi:MAG: hypothetical protein SF339_01100 [Blastocatellia bacterium]|nr:hypothetical protein [Blastocatellia bacterium]
MSSGFDGRWSELMDEAKKEVKQWRLSHPKAKLTEIEQALDEKLGQVRARMLEDLALSSEAAHLDKQTTEWPKCPQCDEPLIRRGQQTRELETNQDQRIRLERSYASCPRCGAGLFPPG